jgi:hypothetical protein
MSGSRFVVGARHFGRFTRTPEENDEALEAARADLTSAVEAAPGDGAGAAVLDAAVDLAEALTIAGREQEAVALARPAVQVARDTGRGETLRWGLLVLATAEHYAAEVTAAETHFREALELARASGDRPDHLADPADIRRRHVRPGDDGQRRRLRLLARRSGAHVRP